MVSKFMEQLKADRIAASQFKVGTEVAIVNTHWGRRIEGKRTVLKVYKNGNFTITGVPGRAYGGGTHEQQWRPNLKGDMADMAGERGTWSREHLEPWSPAIEAEIADRKLLRRLEARRDRCIEALKEKRGDDLRNMARGFNQLEVLLGLDAQDSPQPDDSMDSSG